MLEIEIYHFYSRCIEVDGCTDSTVIADNFSNYFKKIYTCNDQTRADKLKADFYKLRNGYCGLPVPCDLDFDTELVYKAFTKLKRGKAADIFGLSAEHQIFSHILLCQ